MHTAQDYGFLTGEGMKINSSIRRHTPVIAHLNTYLTGGSLVHARLPTWHVLLRRAARGSLAVRCHVTRAAARSPPSGNQTNPISTRTPLRASLTIRGPVVRSPTRAAVEIALPPRGSPGDRPRVPPRRGASPLHRDSGRREDRRERNGKRGRKERRRHRHRHRTRFVYKSSRTGTRESRS